MIFSSLDDELARRFFPPAYDAGDAGSQRAGQRLVTLVQRSAQRRAEAIAYSRRARCSRAMTGWMTRWVSRGASRVGSAWSGSRIHSWVRAFVFSGHP